jgi:methylase of polypeptide subunit release factors
MPISKSQLTDIKSRFQKFIAADAFGEKEEHVQSWYTTKILETLGWNESNVIINKPQDVKTTRRPDILLKGRGGGTIYVIESKEPSKSLDDRYPLWTFPEQTCFYINSEGVSWGILTNFKEWRIYNAHTYELNESIYKTLTVIDDSRKVACSDEQLSDFFSLIEYGALSAKRGKISPDSIYYPKQEEIKDKFFKNLKEWRLELKRHLTKTEPELSPAEIDTQTQRILDRLIFMDYCYDKTIIAQDYLGAVQFSKHQFYSELKRIFQHELNEKFNSELFAKDKCDSFDIPNDILEDIIKGIRQIDYSTLNVHIIGEVYENYLGELLKAGRKKTDENKEQLKRKSQGIYYTPDYIVSYIVENTVGKVLETCKDEKDVEAVRVIDPACGSGSFLIRAFEVFYQKYVELYLKKHRQLSPFSNLEISKKILSYNLFGVDLDERAVEIARFNLLVAALEKIGDTQKSGNKILPNLSLNIRFGNSLVSGKIEEGAVDLFSKKSDYKADLNLLIELKHRFDKEASNDERHKLLTQIERNERALDNEFNEYLHKYKFKRIEDIKPLNYEVKFCDVFKHGKFDCIIGNPPYVQLSMEENFSPAYKEYLLKEYGSSMGRLNTFGFFLRRSTDLVRDNGYIGMIIPNTLLTQEYYQELRKHLLDTCDIKSIVNYDKLPFKDAVVENVTIVLNKAQTKDNKIDLIDYEGEDQSKKHSVSQSKYQKTYGNQFVKIASAGEASLQNKILKVDHFLLGEKTNINQAIALKADRAKYLFDSKKGDTFKPVLDGRYIDRYGINWDGSYLKYDLKAIHSCKRTDIFTTREKFFFRRVNGSLMGAYDNKQFFALNTLVVVTLNEGIKDYSIKYILGIFNSKLLNYYYTKFLKSTKKVYSEIQARQVEQLPIREIDFKNATDKKYYDKIVKLVDEITALKKLKNPDTQKIDALDTQLDSVVYKLYDIGEKEQKIIEAS